MFAVCLDEYFNNSALACFCMASRVDLDMQVDAHLDLLFGNVCPGVGPSGTVDSCAEMLKMKPLNFSRMMILCSVPSSVL